MVTEAWVHTFVAVLASTLYCSSTRSRSSSLGILKRVMRSMGAIVFVFVLALVLVIGMVGVDSLRERVWREGRPLRGIDVLYIPKNWSMEWMNVGLPAGFGVYGVYG